MYGNSGTRVVFRLLRHVEQVRVHRLTISPRRRDDQPRCHIYRLVFTDGLWIIRHDTTSVSNATKLLEARFHLVTRLAELDSEDLFEGHAPFLQLVDQGILAGRLPRC